MPSTGVSLTGLSTINRARALSRYDRCIDFYGTTAQVIPVLLLALIWESRYLENLKGKDLSQRPLWTASRIRIWALFMSAAAVTGEAATVLVLAKAIDDGAIPKAVALTGIGALLATLCVRLAADILDATKRRSSEPPTGEPPSRDPAVS